LLFLCTHTGDLEGHGSPSRNATKLLPPVYLRDVRVHVCQHVQFEGIGSIAAWASARRAEVSHSRLWEKGASLPRPADFDMLILMGGPMSANDEGLHPWLRAEKRLVAAAIEAGHPVLGICLGAQIIAAALGARVYANPRKEIRWFPVWKPSAGVLPRVAAAVPDGSLVFHWHGETFDLPVGAARFFQSDACVNQAFAIDERVVGLQFHLEVTPESVAEMARHGRNELVRADYVQTEAELLSEPGRCAAPNAAMAALLDALAPV
jgi:GMP synthase-like glutamine amidotransferase